MNIFLKIWRWLFEEKKEAPAIASVEPLSKVVKSESIPLSKLDIKRNRIKAWRNKTFKKKPNRIPFAKWAEPEKYF